MKIKKYFLTLFLILFFSVGCISAHAEEFADKWYQIEIIVFSHLSEQAIDSEQWPSVHPPNFSHAGVIQLLDKNQKARLSNQYRLLSKNQFGLLKENQLLQKKPGYQVLLHLIWQQKVQTPEQAKPIHIYNDFTQTNHLNGTITIGVKKYFDVHVNLFLGVPVSKLIELSKTSYFRNLSGKIAYFHLLQTRRMRSDELNYIDHPLYGVLIKIKRIGNHIT